MIPQTPLLPCWGGENHLHKPAAYARRLQPSHFQNHSDARVLRADNISLHAES